MKGYETKQYEGIPAGQLVQRTIGKGPKIIAAGILPALTYRIRRSNGFGGSTYGELIQDRYPYFVPSSINNPEGQAARDKFTLAIIEWQALSADDKKFWNAEVWREHRNMSGYNLYIRKYMLDEI